MHELLDDPFYKFIEDYDDAGIDYFLIENDRQYQGYASHKDAILFVMETVKKGWVQLQFNIEKATAELINPVSFLHTTDTYQIRNTGGQIPYFYAFMKPPYGSGYDKDDFDKVNNILFPNGASSLEVYEWSTDWSNYFDAGHEWWGAACWSVYDCSLNRYVVIIASSTY